MGWIGQIIARASSGQDAMSTRPQITVAHLLLVLTVSWAVARFSEGADMRIHKGDTLVTTARAPVQVGSTIRAWVDAGTEFVATGTHGDWVGIVVQLRGESIKGWISSRYLTGNPTATLSEVVSSLTSSLRFRRLDGDASGLMDLREIRAAKFEPNLSRNADAIFKLLDQGRDGSVCEREFHASPTECLLLQMDCDGDGALDRDEFLAGTRMPTLDDLNRQLPTPAAIDRTLDGISTAFVAMDSFESWKPNITLDDIGRLGREYKSMGDIRRSSLAQRLVDNKAINRRSKLAAWTFKWADKNGDGRLELREFKEVHAGYSAGPSVRAGTTGSAEKRESARPERQDLLAESVASDNDISRVTEKLRDQDSNVRLSAAQHLARRGFDAEPAVPALAKALEDRDCRIRLCVAETLKNLGFTAEPAVPALAKALQDKDSRVRRCVAETLQNLGFAAERAVPQLAQALEDDDTRVRICAVQTLQDLGFSAKAAAPALRRALNDKNSTVRDHAAKALQDMGY